MGETAAKAHVLVVDDEPGVCNLLRDKLSLEGYTCQSYNRAQQALDALARERFDVVISDLRMPGLTGLDLLRETRSKYPHSVFLMATGEDDVRVGIQAMKMGAADYIVKPFHLEMVMTSIEQALYKKRLETELEEHRHHLEQMVQDRTQQLQDAMLRIETTYDETLAALGAALEFRDIETEDHSRRVSRYCLEMARAIRCTDLELRDIARGSYLHDVGKIGIPDTILLKPGRLTADEAQLMQSHPRVGYELVRRIAFLRGAAEIVLTHHERYDGKGYPQGIEGNQIPLGARIFAVADTLDAMTSDRPYRKALPPAAAREEIMREAGRQFDAKVVEVFLSLPEELWERIRTGTIALDRERRFAFPSQGQRAAAAAVGQVR
jgi:putative nucleotidyltransferase with HDIG domain